MTVAKPHERLVELLAGGFEANARSRGKTYAREGRVRLERVGAQGADALVRGQGDVYSTGFRHVENGWASTCSCPRFAAGHRCKHLWALLVAVDAAGWRLAGVAGRSLSDSRLVHPNPWRARVAEMHADTPPRARRPATQREERLWYVISIDLSILQDALLVEVRRSHRLKRGGWSVPSPFAPLDVRATLPTPADERICSLLKGATERYALGREKQFALDALQAEALLPLMAAAGGLCWDSFDDPGGGPLTYVEGESWCLQRTVRKSPRPGEIEVAAHWKLGSGVATLEEVRCALPGGFLIVGERIGRVADVRDCTWAWSIQNDGPLAVPLADLPALLRELADTAAATELDDGLDLVRRDVLPRPRLTLEAPDDLEQRIAELRGTVAFEYDGVRVSAADAAALLEREGALIARRPDLERTRIARAHELGARPCPDDALALRVPIERLGELTRALDAEGWIIEGEGARYRAAGASSVALKSGIDWFELEGVVDFGGAKATLPELLAAARRKQRVVRLGDGTIGVVPEEWLARFGPLVALGNTRRGGLRFGRSQAWLLDALLAGRDDVAVDARFREQVDRLRQFKRIEAVGEPAAFQGELRPYQREGLGWLEFLERHGLGGCLADDMGLGKTVQVLAWLLARRARRTQHAATLVVAPKSLTHNWIAEARRFTPQLRTLDYTGSARRSLADELEHADLVVTTYGTMRNDIEHLGDVGFDCVVLDEAQAIKNSASLTAKAARLLQAEHRLALSGTPVENHLGELWSLFEFLNPGMLGRSSVFAELVDTARDAALDADARSLLASVVRPFVLRRTKEQVLRDLPDKTEQTITCDLDARQRREYRALQEHYRRILLDGPERAELDHFTVLEALLRLRQAACHPGLIDPARSGESSAKLEALFEMLEDVLGAQHKALVFSQFTSLLAIVRARLDADGTPYAYLDGKTPARTRTAQVRRFQEDPDCRLFLSSLKAGGLGLNLTAADYVFLLDPWWNPASEAQAIGRAHRIGQSRSVFAYRFVCADTIEERVLELQSRKRELAAVILEGEATTLRDLTREDLQRLLR